MTSSMIVRFDHEFGRSAVSGKRGLLRIFPLRLRARLRALPSGVICANRSAAQAADRARG